jgi:hypothetical protein
MRVARACVFCFVFYMSFVLSYFIAPPPLLLLQHKCTYCGMGELQLCSPLVVAQSRAEHEACVALAAAPYPTADGFYGDGVTGTAVHFMNQVKKNICCSK